MTALPDLLAVDDQVGVVVLRKLAEVGEVVPAEPARIVVEDDAAGSEAPVVPPLPVQLFGEVDDLANRVPELPPILLQLGQVRSEVDAQRKVHDDAEAVAVALDLSELLEAGLRVGRCLLVESDLIVEVNLPQLPLHKPRVGYN